MQKSNHLEVTFWPFGDYVEHLVHMDCSLIHRRDKGSCWNWNDKIFCLENISSSTLLIFVRALHFLSLSPMKVAISLAFEGLDSQTLIQNRGIRKLGCHKCGSSSLGASGGKGGEKEIRLSLASDGVAMGGTIFFRKKERVQQQRLLYAIGYRWVVKKLFSACLEASFGALCELRRCDS